tara:strand:+ start:313 stop:1008 length:696 start_codon:yes stop_codon:yes gene_type:complete
MANVTAKCQIQLNDGSVVSMSGTVAEGTETELQTSTTYSVSATSLGQFADGKTITSFIQPVSAPNGIAYAYINRRGEIAAIVPIAHEGEVQTQPLPLCGMANFRLQAGDTLQVMANTASDREFAYMVRTNQGVSAIFSATPSGAGNSDLTHILSGQGAGTSLVGQTIVQHAASSVDGSKLSTGGVLVLNDKGLPVNGCTATDPQAQPVLWAAPSTMTQIGLNFVARVTTSS